jgi:hypothetical protein
MLPADERLLADQLLVGEADLRLEVQPQLPVLERTAQPGGDLQSLFGALAKVVVEELMAPAPELLGGRPPRRRRAAASAPGRRRRCCPGPRRRSRRWR